MDTGGPLLWALGPQVPCSFRSGVTLLVPHLLPSLPSKPSSFLHRDLLSQPVPCLLWTRDSKEAAPRPHGWWLRWVYLRVYPKHLPCSFPGMTEDSEARSLLLRSLPGLLAFCASLCSCTGSSQGQWFVKGSVCPIPMPEGPSGQEQGPTLLPVPVRRAHLRRSPLDVC